MHKDTIFREGEFLWNSVQNLQVAQWNSLKSVKNPAWKSNCWRLERRLLHLPHEKERTDNVSYTTYGINITPKPLTNLSKKRTSCSVEKSRSSKIRIYSEETYWNANEISEILNEQFISVFTPSLRQLQVSNITGHSAAAKAVLIDYMNINVDGVIKYIDEMRPKSVTSSDGFSTILLRTSKQVQTRPAKFFYQSFQATAKILRNL